MVESQPSKLLVAGSIPVSRSNLRSLRELRLASQRARRETVRRRPTYRPEGEGSEGRLVGRSREAAEADVAQLAERVLGKDEVTSSILVIGSILRSPVETNRRAMDGKPRLPSSNETAERICGGFDSDVTEDENG